MLQFLFCLLISTVVVFAQNRTIPIGPGFWNVRSSFIIDGIDIGTHMSLIQLQNGNFLIVDTVLLDSDLLNDINVMTKNGTLIEAVIATHPFHTTYFPAFYQQFPKPPYYGTPRHLRIEPQVPWAGSMYDCINRQRWLPEVHMRIPRGAEFVNPQPESTNHFSGIHVFHPPSKAIHVDDTVDYNEPLAGDMVFHPSILDGAIYHIPEAPSAFRDWVQKYINEWDFDNICAAHNGIKQGGAKAQLQSTLNDYAVVFEALILAYTIAPNATDEATFQAMQQHEAMCSE
jgi:hypothetical protein